jgi:hypothetical protein
VYLFIIKIINDAGSCIKIVVNKFYSFRRERYSDYLNLNDRDPGLVYVAITLWCLISRSTIGTKVTVPYIAFTRAKTGPFT